MLSSWSINGSGLGGRFGLSASKDQREFLSDDEIGRSILQSVGTMRFGGPADLVTRTVWPRLRRRVLPALVRCSRLTARRLFQRHGQSLHART